MEKNIEKGQTDPLEQKVLDALRSVKDPDLHKDIVSLNFIKDLKVEPNRASFTIELTTPACPVKKQMEDQAREAVLRVKGIREVDIRMSASVTAGRRGAAKQEIAGVRNIIAVGSGKGGVGKSTVTVNLAVALARAGAKVGLMDADIYGPNIPLMIGITGQPHAVNERIQPLANFGVKVMSMGFLTGQDTPVIWRGPMLHNVIQQFVRQVDWGELDYLLVDLPPGTGDAQLSLAQLVPLTGGIIVSTPQEVALLDARRGFTAFQRLSVPVLGIVENMAGAVFFHSCGNIYPLLGDLVDAGVDILNPVQVSAGKMGDTARLKREFGDRLSFCGGIDTRWVMPHGTTDDVRAEVRRRIRDLAPGGGYIAAAVHCIQPDVPPENVVAMCDEVRSAGRYPLAGA